MSSEITPTERRLIDEAIAAGRVQIIPTGNSAEIECIWNGRDLVSVANLSRGAFTETTKARFNSWARARRLAAADRRAAKEAKA